MTFHTGLFPFKFTLLTLFYHEFNDIGKIVLWAWIPGRGQAGFQVWVRQNVAALEELYPRHWPLNYKYKYIC
jgi:hypothetical protein